MEGDRSSYGTGLARITDVRLSRTDGRPFTWIDGGEEVLLTLRIEAHAIIDAGVAGFILKDRLGQSLLGDNTVDLYLEKPVTIREGDVAEARFRFLMPLLASGSYSICPAFASGTQENHVQHHWIHDALLFDVHAPRQMGATILSGAQERSIELVAAATDRL